MFHRIQLGVSVSNFCCGWIARHLGLAPWIYTISIESPDVACHWHAHEVFHALLRSSYALCSLWSEVLDPSSRVKVTTMESDPKILTPKRLVWAHQDSLLQGFSHFSCCLWFWSILRFFVAIFGSFDLAQMSNCCHGTFFHSDSDGLLMEIIEITKAYCEDLPSCRGPDLLLMAGHSGMDQENTGRWLEKRRSGQGQKKLWKTPRDGFCHDERNKSVTLRIFCIILLILRFWACIFIYDTDMFAAKVFLKKQSIHRLHTELDSLQNCVTTLAISVLATDFEDNLTLSVINILVFFSFAFEDLHWVGEVETENHLAMWNWRFLREWLKMDQKEIREASRCNISKNWRRGKKPKLK